MLRVCIQQAEGARVSDAVVARGARGAQRGGAHLFTPGCTWQGEGGVPDVAPGSGWGVPVLFLKKHRPEEATKVKEVQRAAVALPQAPQQAEAEAAGTGGPVMVPSVLTPGCRLQVGPGLPTEPDTTCESGWSASTLSLR